LASTSIDNSTFRLFRYRAAPASRFWIRDGSTESILSRAGKLITGFGFRIKTLETKPMNPFLSRLSSEDRISKTCAAFDKLRRRPHREKRRRSIENPKLVLTVALVVTLVMSGAMAQAQQTGTIPRIVFLRSFGTPGESQLKPFRQGLKELGYVEGKTIVLDPRHPKDKPEATPDLVSELMKNKVDIFVAVDTTAIRALKKVTQTIPIVMVSSQDPVAAGLVESLARPGGNVTGLTRLTRELSGKRLELLKEVVPKIRKVGVLWVRPTALGTGNAFKNYEGAAEALKLQLQSLPVSRPKPDFDGAFQSATKGQVNALVIVTHAVLTPYRNKIAEIANKQRIPTLCEQSQSTDAGCLMSYATNDDDSYRRAAVYVDRILKGAKPADLPVEQAAKFEFVINLKTAKEIGLTISQSVLYRADKVIR
jgi:putative ABC transport system substrate-binding protein